MKKRQAARQQPVRNLVVDPLRNVASPCNEVAWFGVFADLPDFIRNEPLELNYGAALRGFRIWSLLVNAPGKRVASDAAVPNNASPVLLAGFGPASGASSGGRRG